MTATAPMIPTGRRRASPESSEEEKISDQELEEAAEAAHTKKRILKKRIRKQKSKSATEPLTVMNESAAASSGIVIFLCIAQLVLVFSLSRSLTRGNTTSTLVKFLLYAAFTGVSFSSIFLYFRAETLVLCFLATAASFGGMALYGLYSKRDILSWGGTLFGGLIGLLVLMLLGFFLSVPTFHLFISVLGVLVFMGMTAYDTRKLSLMYDHAAGTRAAQAYSIYGAFQLYLDFINLFLYLVRLIGLTDRD